MNRRNFIKTLACAAAALAGVNAKAEEIVTGVGRGSPLIIDNAMLTITNSPGDHFDERHMRIIDKYDIVHHMTMAIPEHRRQVTIYYDSNDEMYLVEDKW